ncbi:MAG: sugar ABC transporter permease [Clostridia bacterium]|nr:sugar ABC transporter permease [Clostridia bacterium]
MEGISAVKRKKPRHKSIYETGFIILMLAYPVAHFIVFWGIVNFNSILRTFQRYVMWQDGKLVNSWVWAGLDNYKNVWTGFSRADTKRIIGNSLGYMVVSNFISLPLAIISSYFLFKKMPFAKWFRVIFFLPSIIPIVVLATVFRFQFDARFGLVNGFLNIFGIESPSWFGVYPNSQRMIYLYCIWAGLGFNVLLLSGAISRLPVDLFEYSHLEGMPYVKEFFRIVIPLIWPTITTTFLLGLTSVFGVMLQPMMIMPGDANTQTIALKIYNSVRTANETARPEIIAFGLLLSVMAMPFILAIKFGMEKIYADVEF